MSESQEPLRQTEFKVELDGTKVPGFIEVQLPSQRTKSMQYREGNDPSHNRQLGGDTEYDDLVLVRGATKENSTLFDWRKKADKGQRTDATKNISVVLMNRAGDAVIRFEFTRAWIKEYRPPTLNARASSGGDSVATEEYVVTFDEMTRKNQ